MSFRQFLCEKVLKNNRTAIVIQQLLDNLDTSHIQYSTAKIKGNIGQIIQKGNLSNLYLVIKHDDSEELSAKLGKIKNTDNYAIVIRTPDDLPARDKIDSFIADNDDVFQALHEQIDKYFDVGIQTTTKTKYEKIKETNTPESFEAVYQGICDSMDSKIKDYSAMVTDLKKKRDFTNSDGKKQTIDMAIKNLKKSTMGDSFSEFYKKATEEHTNAVNSLDKTMLSKLKERLNNYYEQH